MSQDINLLITFIFTFVYQEDILSNNSLLWEFKHVPKNRPATQFRSYFLKDYTPLLQTDALLKMTLLNPFWHYHSSTFGLLPKPVLTGCPKR